MATKTLALNTAELLEEVIIDFTVNENFTSHMTCIRSSLKQRGIDASIGDVTEAINLGVKEDKLKIFFAKDINSRENWTIRLKTQ